MGRKINKIAHCEIKIWRVGNTDLETRRQVQVLDGEVKEEAFEANVNREEIERKGKVHVENHLGSKEEKTKKKAVVFCYYFVFPPQVTIEESAIVTNDMSLENVLTFLRLFMSWCSKVQQKLLYWTLKCLLTFANKCKNNLLLRFDFLKSENSSFF